MNFKLLLLFLFCTTNLLAQDSFYSYMTDKKFQDPTDLEGYNFVPSKLEIPNETEEELSPGEYTFGVTRSNLYVSGGDLAGVYNINNITPVEYGFKLTLMNSRDPRLQGHLKVILINKVYVDALIFKAEKDSPEIIFLLPEMNDHLWENEKNHFTDKYEVALEYESDIWNTTIHPFFRVQTKGTKVQERLQMKDSTAIVFIEDTRIIDKTKPQKPKKEKKKKKKDNFNIETGEFPDELQSETSEEEIVEVIEEVEDVEEEIVEEEEAYEDDEMEEEEIKEEKKKIKTITDYTIELRTVRKNQDGSVDNIVEAFKVKNVKEREDESANSGGERYQIEFDTNRGPLYLYLTGKRTVSSFEIGGERYLMRGH